MRRTSNYSLLLPDDDDSYKVSDMNTNSGIIDAQMKSNQNAASSVTSSFNSHATNKNNPHEVTKSQIGLGNVPNVSTNDQTPTYSDTTSLVTLVSGEKLNVAMQKIKYAITSLINHIGNKANPHVVTKAQVGLGNVDNTSDANKPVSTATQTALNGKSNTNHTHNYAGSSSAGGVATSANKLQMARTISLTGDVTGSVSFDGSQNVSIATTSQAKVPAEIAVITMTQDFRFDGGKLARYGDIVTLSLRFTNLKSFGSGAGYTICNIPEEYRPEIAMYFWGIASFYISIPIIIETNGNVNVHPYSTLNANSNCGFTVTWNIKKS